MDTNKLRLKTSILDIKSIQRAFLGYVVLKVINNHKKGSALTILEIKNLVSNIINEGFNYELVDRYLDKKSKFGKPFTVHYSVIHTIVGEFLTEKIIDRCESDITYSLTQAGSELFNSWGTLLKTFYDKVVYND